MFRCTGSSIATQSVRDFVKNIPSRLTSWFQGKFVTIANRMKCFISVKVSSRSARQSDQTTIVERRVASDSQKQGYFSLVMTSGSQLFTNDPLQPVINGAIIRYICVVRLGSVTGRFKKFMGDLQAKANLLIETSDKEADSIEQLRTKYDDDLFVLLAKKLDVEESIINDRDNYDVEQKIKLLKDTLGKQRSKLSGRLDLIQYYFREYLKKVVESRQFGDDLSSKYEGGSPKLASKEEITELRSKILWFELMAGEFSKINIVDQIASDTTLQTDLFNIQKELQNLMRELDTDPPHYDGPR